MRRVGSFLLALLALTTSNFVAGAPAPDGLGHDARVFALDLAGRSTMPPPGEARESSTGPFAREEALVAAPGVEGARASLLGGSGITQSRIVLDRVVLPLPGSLVEAHGVESRAHVACAGSEGDAAVRSLRVNGAPVQAGSLAPGARVPLAGGLVLIVDEQSSTRSLAGVTHVTAALRVRDAAGASVAVAGFAEAKLTGCITQAPGVCEGFVPALTGAARAKGSHGRDIALMASNRTEPRNGEAAGFAWRSGVPTFASISFSPQANQATMAVHGTSHVMTAYLAGAPVVDAIVVEVRARDGDALVEDVTVDGILLPARLTPDGLDAVTIRGATLRQGFELGAVATLAWDDLPGDPDALGFDIRLGHCP